MWLGWGEGQGSTVLQQIIPLLFTTFTIGGLVAGIAPLFVLPLAFFGQLAGEVAVGVAPAYPGVVGEGVACVGRGVGRV